MLQSSDILSIINRLMKSNLITQEDVLILSELIQTYTANGNVKIATILKIFFSYQLLLHPDKSFSGEFDAIASLKEAIRTIRFNELELYIPSKFIEWILLKLGYILLSNEHYKISKQLIEISRDCFKLVEHSYGTTLSNYFLAYYHYLEGDADKCARLLEIVSTEFSNPSMQISCQYNAAILYYSTNNANLKRPINLLENCLILLDQYSVENLTPRLDKEIIEDFLNKLRREYILKNYMKKENDLFQVIENLTSSLHKNGKFLDLAASYYEAGTVFDNLNYGDTAEDYFIESARLSAEKEEWKLYSKCLIQLIIKFIEKGELQDAEIYLNDLSIIAVQLQDEGLLKKTETLLNSLKKLKIQSNMKDISTNDIESLLGTDVDNEPQLTFSNQITPSQEGSMTSDEQDLFNQVLESQSDGQSNDIVSFQTDTEKIEPETPVESIASIDNSKPTFYNTRQQIVIKLNDRGFDTYLDMKPIKGGATVDIVAIKGKIRKKKLYVMLAETKAEAELSVNLLKSLQDSTEKIVYVFGESSKKQKKSGITIAYKMNQLVFN